MSLVKLLAAIAIIVLNLVAGAVWMANTSNEPAMTKAVDAAPTQGQIVQGAYLARVGNCIGCHSPAGGAVLAGGLGIKTPFGTIYSSNITPEPATGIGTWNSAHFYRALHNGRSKEGRLLYPAFPYEHFTHLSRSDSDAIFAWLRSQAPVSQPNRPHELRFPYGLQASLAVWRAFYFTPAELSVPPPQAGDALLRGAYLARGLGHCGACHTPRNSLAAADLSREFQGGELAGQGWYAPSLTAPDQASVARWPDAEVISLLKTGQGQGRWVSGPMAEVVHQSTQHWSDADLLAMTRFLKSLPQTSPWPAPARGIDEAGQQRIAAGEKIYEQHCASCHGATGRGVSGAYPALAGNRAVTMARPDNLIRMVLHGGYAPSTQGNPRPYGMAPYAPFLTDDEIASVLTYVRNSWGNQAGEVAPLKVRR